MFDDDDLVFLLSWPILSFGFVPFAAPLCFLSSPSFSTSARLKIPCSRSLPIPVIWKLRGSHFHIQLHSSQINFKLTKCKLQMQKWIIKCVCNWTSSLAAVEGNKVGLEVGRDGCADVPPSVELSERREQPANGSSLCCGSLHFSRNVPTWRGSCFSWSRSQTAAWSRSAANIDDCPWTKRGRSCSTWRKKWV